MKGTRFIAGLFFALTLTGLFMRAGSIMGAWMSALGMTILHIILALVLLTLMGSFLRRHVGGKSSAKLRALPLLASLLGVMVSGVALLLVGQRGRLPLVHWIFSLSFLIVLFRHVGSILLRPALSDPALMMKLACIVAACLAIILTNRFLQQKTVLASEQILNTSVNIVGPLPGYDHGSMSPDSCANCHSQIVNEWKQSLHAVSDTEIVYARVVGEFRRKYSFEASNWCAGCHSPLRVARGELSTKVADVKQPNVDCVTCHSIQQIHEPIGSNNYDLSIQPAAGYAIGGTPRASDWLLRMQPAAHRARWNGALTKKPEFCGACHRQVLPEFLMQSKDTLTLQDTFGEWERSRFNGSDPAQRKTCQDCHMPSTRGLASILGTDAPSHLFAGGSVDIAQLSGARTRLAALRQLLTNTASVSLEATACRTQNVELLVKVTNYGAGHNLPTGVTDLREVWLEVTVTDSSGRILYRSGAIDKDGFLDPLATRFGVKLGDAERNPVHLHDIARARYILQDTTIPSGETREARYTVPIGDTARAKIDVRLLYRTVPQNFLNHYMTSDLRFQSTTMAASSLLLDVPSRCASPEVAVSVNQP